MELFYSSCIEGNTCILDKEESNHCIRVLRHRIGDQIMVIDGQGTLYKCTLAADLKNSAEALVVSTEENWGGHPYNLTLAVCPTKNNDRFEWFAEKATEIGVDKIVPVVGDHSERKVFKTDRLKKIVLSATKQSLKAKLPEICEPISVKEFIKSTPLDCLKLIAYCFEDASHPRISIKDALSAYSGKDIVVLIGPEGDFSTDEAILAIESGFQPVHLGQSRLRTETAALVSAGAVYFNYM